VSTDIVRYEEGSLSFPKCHFSDTSLVIDPAISGKEYLNLWDGLKKSKPRFTLVIGDAYIFGELNVGFTLTRCFHYFARNIRKRQ